jgi:hypothetical protein
VGGGKSGYSTVGLGYALTPHILVKQHIESVKWSFGSPGIIRIGIGV